MRRGEQDRKDRVSGEDQNSSGTYTARLTSTARMSTTSTTLVNLTMTHDYSAFGVA